MELRLQTSLKGHTESQRAHVGTSAAASVNVDESNKPITTIS